MRIPYLPFALGQLVSQFSLVNIKSECVIVNSTCLALNAELEKTKLGKQTGNADRDFSFRHWH